MVILVPALLVASAGLLVYFLIIEPRNKRKPLIRALEILGQDPRTDDELREVEQLLEAAITAGLKPHDVDEARFALAYTRSRLGEYAEASAALAELIKKGSQDREVLYLDLWLHARLKQYDEIEQVFSKHQDLLKGYRQANLIAGIAFLSIARKHWKVREIEKAVGYFEKLRKLEVLTEEIPQRISNHQMVLGLMDLFDRNVEDARTHFAGAKASTQGDSVALCEAELGLLLCEWVQEDTPDIDEQLSGLVHSLERDGKCEELLSRMGEDQEDRDKKFEEKELLYRSVLLWHAVSLIFTWLRLPKGDGLDKGRRKELSARLSKIGKLDPAMSDPLLLEGLIDYYFSSDHAKRQEALKRLEKGIDLGVNVPEILNLVEREQKLKQLERDSLNRFLALLKRYLSDKEVPEQVRNDLKARFLRFSQFSELEHVEIGDGNENALPSVRDIQSRADILRNRVENIVRPRMRGSDPQETERITVAMSELQELAAAITENTRGLEKAEQSLMMSAGEFLIKEDEESTQKP